MRNASIIEKKVTQPIKRHSKSACNVVMTHIVSVNTCAAKNEDNKTGH